VEDQAPEVRSVPAGSRGWYAGSDRGDGAMSERGARTGQHGGRTAAAKRGGGATAVGRGEATP